MPNSIQPKLRLIEPQGEHSAAQLLSWSPWTGPRNSLLGYCTIDFGGWQIARIPVFRTGDGGISAGTPGTADVGADGRQIMRDGKRSFTNIVTFTTADARARWNRVVLDALAAAGIRPGGDA